MFKCTLAVALLLSFASCAAPASNPDKFPLYAVDLHDYGYYSMLDYDAYTCIRMGYNFVFPINSNYFSYVSASADAADQDKEWYGWQWAYSTDANFCGSLEYEDEDGDQQVRYNDKWCQSYCSNKGNINAFRVDGSDDAIDWMDNLPYSSDDSDSYPL